MSADPLDEVFPRLAPRPVDPSTARMEFGLLRPAYRRARRRHRVRLGAAGTVFALSTLLGLPVVLAAVGSQPSISSTDFSTEGVPTQGPLSTDADGVESHELGETDPPQIGDSAVELVITDQAGGEDGSEGPEKVEAAPVGGDADGSADGSRDDGPHDDGPAVGPGAPTVPPAPVESFPPESASSAGGSVSYLFREGVLELLSVEPADGFEQEMLEEGESAIKVRFTQGVDFYELEIEVDQGIVEFTIKRPGDHDGDGDHDGHGDHDGDGD